MITYTDPIPEGATVIASRPHKGGQRPCAIQVAALTIGVSDNKLMGVLAVLGHNPTQLRPRFIGERGWWYFEDDQAGTILARCIEFYAHWTVDRESLSFIRLCIERSWGFANNAKMIGEALRDSYAR